MSNAAEIERLAELHRQGTLNDEEFARAKARVLGAGDAAAPPSSVAVNTLRRSRTDRWLGGVCAGLARISGLESWIWRLLFTILALFGGTGVVAYLLLWIFVPEE
jgi:phage shock protein C